MKIRCWELYLFPLEELHCGFGIQQGNILPSLNYIPGRVVRGGLANWALRTGALKDDQDPRFEQLFVNKRKPDSNISFPCCTFKGFVSAPLSLFELKGGATEDPHVSLISDRSLAIPYKGANLTDNKSNQPIDFLRRGLWPSQFDLSLKQTNGFIDSGDTLVPNVKPVLDLRAAHEEETGRVGKDGLYAEEALPASSTIDPKRFYYAGELRHEEVGSTSGIFRKLTKEGFVRPQEMLEDAIRDLILDPPPEHVAFMGRRRVPVAIYAVDKGVTDTESTELLPQELKRLEMAELFTITFTSDYQSSFPLDPVVMWKDMGQGDSLGKRRLLFCRPGTLFGYDVKIGKKNLPPRPSVIAGSCGCFELQKELSPASTASLWKHMLLGIGPDAMDGYGRFIINWSIHE